MQIVRRYLIDEVFKVKYHISITTALCYNKFRLEIQYYILNSRSFLQLGYAKNIIRIITVFLLAQSLSKWEVRNLIRSIVTGLIYL